MHIYALARPSDPIVKIGHTTNLDRRFNTYVSANPTPVAVLGYWIGDLYMESVLHDAFVDLRVHGEWYDFTGRDPITEITHLMGEEPLQYISPKRRPQRTRHVQGPPHSKWQIVNRMEFDLREPRLTEQYTLVWAITSHGTRIAKRVPVQADGVTPVLEPPDVAPWQHNSARPDRRDGRCGSGRGGA